MEISLIVCTRNRAGQLGEALPYFAQLDTSASWEIVLVNNGSTDSTADVLNDFVERSGLDARVIDQPGGGLAAARNAGWRQSSAELIAFTDDDCYPAPDYLEQIRACFHEADLGYLGGRVLLFDQNDLPVTIQTLQHRVDIPARSFIRTGLIHGANFSFRRATLEAVGNFDERLGAGTPIRSGEDVDILARASAQGFAGAYDPRPLVFHHHRRSKPDEIERLTAGHDIGRGAYFAKALMDRRSRRAYVKPVLRWTCSNIKRRNAGKLRREFNGAWKYIRG